jgi:hypothetical protein
MQFLCCVIGAFYELGNKLLHARSDHDRNPLWFLGRSDRRITRLRNQHYARLAIALCLGPASAGDVKV